jgi:pSer/pThr/pTyr-binding forkhead associated (FHA) protein
MFKLELKLQDLTIKEYSLQDGDSLSIGRLSSNDIVIKEKSVSREHANIARQNNTLTVWDLGSTNGTSVNGVKIQSARLKDGDVVKVGSEYHLKTTISSPKKRESTMTAEPDLFASPEAGNLDFPLEWHNNGKGKWWTLAEANVEDDSFDNLEGVYIIWYEDQNQVTLRVGRGHIRDCIVKERNSKDMWRYAQQHELYLTWAQVGSRYSENITKYIAETVKPKFKSSHSDVEPFVVNLPWSSEGFSPAQ